MNKKINLLIAIVLSFLVTPQFSEAATETVKIYAAEGDGQAGIGEFENQTSWLNARSYEGAVTFTLQDTEDTNSARSDIVAGSYRIYRGSIPFDTSTIPDNSVIESATLNLYAQGNSGSQGGAKACVTTHNRQDILNIVGSDYYLSNHCSLELSISDLLKTGEYTAFNLNKSGIDSINISGNSVFSIRTNYDCENVDPGGGIKAVNWYSSEKAGTEFDPYLEITYTVPEEITFPLYTQRESIYPSAVETASWASTTYAEGKGNLGKYKCGLTIAQCGCAITSLVMSARSRGVSVGSDGTEINPGSLNHWLEQNSGYTQYGSIIWSAAAKYFGTVSDGVYSSRYQGITFGNSDPMGAIDAALATSSQDAVGYKAGHYVFLSDKTTDSYIVRDPFWYDTVTANDNENDDNKGTVNDYNNSFEQARIFTINDEASEIKGSIEVVIASPVELRITQADGLRAGYLNEGVPSLNEIALSGYDRDTYINLEGRLSVPTTTQKHLILNKAGGKNKLELIGVGDGDYSLYVYVTGADGLTYVKENEGVIRNGEVLEFIIDVDTGSIVLVNSDDDDGDGPEYNRGNKSETHNKFFTKWLTKIESELDNGKLHQVRKHLDTFEKLLKAKKESNHWWTNRLEQIRNLVLDSEKEEGERKGRDKKRQ
jgi:hypothetical protein